MKNLSMGRSAARRLASCRWQKIAIMAPTGLNRDAGRRQVMMEGRVLRWPWIGSAGATTCAVRLILR
jgi:hypothetical protein